MTSLDKSLSTARWDPVDRLGTADARSAYLEAAIELGDPELIAAARADIDRAFEKADTTLSSKSHRSV